MFSIQTLTAYYDNSTQEKSPPVTPSSSLEDAYLKASMVDKHPHRPELWSPQGLALGVAHAPRKSLFLFYLAAHELKHKQLPEAFLHTLQGIMAMEFFPELTPEVIPIFRLVFLTFKNLYEGPFRQEVGESLIVGLSSHPSFGSPLPEEEKLQEAARTLAAGLEDDFELIPRTAKFMKDKLIS